MRRATIALAVAAAVILTGLFQRPPAAALGMTQVTLNCTDGTSFTIVVDADTLTGLVASVQGMVDYPAGLNCTLIQVPLLTLFGHVALATNPNTMVVAGGRWLVPCTEVAKAGGFTTAVPPGTVASGANRPTFAMLLPAPLASGSTPCDEDLANGCIWVNIGANVHLNGQGVLEGSINETIPENQSCPNIADVNGPIPLGPSHFDSKPMPASCLFVSGSTALTTTYVTHVFGFTFTVISGLSESPASAVHSQFVDVGNPSSVRDQLNAPPAFPNSECESQGSTNVGNFILRNGNISVYAGS